MKIHQYSKASQYQVRNLSAAAAGLPEVGVLGGENGEELVDGDAELQIPPRHEELQLVLFLPAHLPLHDPQVAGHGLPSP